MKISTPPGTKNPPDHPRCSGPQALAEALLISRRSLFDLVTAYRAALGDKFHVPYSPALNPPLWELGHIGWFEEYWIDRNLHFSEGLSADQGAIEKDRTASLLPDADNLYDSSNVAHVTRWRLALPDESAIVSYLNRIRERTLKRLRSIASNHAAPSDDQLYFFRLALFHEAMHREAWIYMAQHLGISLRDQQPQTADARNTASNAELLLEGGRWQLGSSGAGFAFDNELGASEVFLKLYRIDCSPVTWQRFLPFVEAGGYDDHRWWSTDGWRWRQHQEQALPRYLIRAGTTWQRCCFGEWNELDLSLPAINLNMHEAQAWCRWAGRRLPSEAEWEMAACTSTAKDFAWGEVWEWTASAFAPYPGFTAHPYRDYSQPWFDGRPVLRGASFATDPGMRHPRYRNFFTAERNDIFAGFRSCAL
ncbi:MAG: ergothioneine biosynthesis protein EgtB [Rhodocyclaceae bacterium]|nr:ergothioneine biosynthesis protein EgtB [Rhodocyclaceae bacterium]